MLSYGFFGFFSVYRVVLFTDFAGKSEKLLWIAGMGLMAGRLGDAAGAYSGMKLMDNISVLVLLAALIFMATVFLFILLFQKIYTPAIETGEAKGKGIEDYCRNRQLSPREQEVFKLIAEGLSNTEVADRLFISENTVKFHMKNILRKTESKNRIELLGDYERYKA
ncbi:MAG: helix-turn-helix transcriptional regulator [Lachnospiraceae bacterium]|nr:helix-turn-helix transcriptional regulator [Lachnospiraceae bacterium]